MFNLLQDATIRGYADHGYILTNSYPDGWVRMDNYATAEGIFIGENGETKPATVVSYDGIISRVAPFCTGR